MPAYLAIDLGAESGRVMRGTLVRGRLVLDEIHRFPNVPLRRGAALHWDVPRLLAEVQDGIRRAAAAGPSPRSLGVDTWGVDFGLLGRDGALLENPRHYRDPRTRGMMERAFARVPRREIYERTGIQFMPINTLYQLLAVLRQEPRRLDGADRLLLMGDLFHHLLTGKAAGEVTNASTSQCYDPRARAWAVPLLDRLGIPTRILPPLVRPGTALGPLRPSVAADTGAAGVRVIAPATHDTASAVAAVPAERGARWAYLSSGTWSLIGVESAEPAITDAAYAGNLTNEIGVGNTIRLLKNVMGLWLVQECCRAWEAAGTPTPYEQVAPLALQAPPFRSLIDPDDPRFLEPGGMPAKIRAVCRGTGRPVPEGREAILRCILESLALKYRRVVEKLEAVRGERIEVLHVVGGGSRNSLLNQFTANALGRPVLAGPVEATAIGNVLVQAMACGDIGSLADARAIVRVSTGVKQYLPRDTEAWEKAYHDFTRLTAASASGWCGTPRPVRPAPRGRPAGPAAPGQGTPPRRPRRSPSRRRPGRGSGGH